MDTAILTYKNANLTPDARWLLMRWALVIGLDKSTEYTLQDLFTRLGLTYAQGRRAWDVLTDKKGKNQERFVKIERLPSKGPGRPASRYRLSAKLVKSLEASSTTASCEHYAEEIATLAKTTRLSATGKKADLEENRSRRRTGLTLPNRWLLMVLLAHADSPGVVTCLSVSAMRRLTGMSRYRITSQLKKLINLGLIAHHQSGRYSPKARSRKTSIYLLDLAHPLLGTFKRAPLTIMSPPSTTNPKQTEMVGGIVDAAMTAGVCSLQIDALLKEYDAIKDKSIASDDTKQELKPKHDPYGEAKNYQEKYNKLKRILNQALSLLPSTRYLEGGMEELLRRYDAEDANWLLSSVHIGACHLLTSAWSELKEGFLGPEQPCHDVIVVTARRLGITPEYVIAEPEQESEPASEKADNYTKVLDGRPPTVEPISYSPLALLFYALSHHLAIQLQRAFNPNEHEAAEAMTYMLVPVFLNSPNDSTLPAFQLRSYVRRSEEIDKEPTTTIFRRSVDEDLNTYWRNHHQECLSAINDEPDDSTPDSQEPADQ